MDAIPDPPSRRAWFAAPVPRILAHRGFAPSGSGRVENTLAAFAAAVDQGAAYLESDIRLTADRVPVLSHDPDLGRLAGRPVDVAETTLSGVQQVRLGGRGAERVPTLREALSRFPAVFWNLDVKDPAAAAPAVAEIRAAGAVDRVLLATFSDRTSARLRRGLPDAAFSVPEARLALVVAALSCGLLPVARAALRGFAAVQLPERYRGARVLTPRIVDGLHACGVEVHVWTVNAAADQRRLLDWGVDGLFTDDIATGLRVAREWSAARNR